MTDRAQRRGPGFGNYLLLAASALVMIGVGVGLLVAGLQQRESSSPVKGGVTTTGVVVSYYEHPQTRGSQGYDLDIRFTDRTGRSYTFTTPTVVHKKDIGEVVTVSYDPRNPEHASDVSIGSFQWRFFFGLGLALLVFDAYIGVRYISAWRRATRA